MVQGPWVTLGLDLFGDINAVNGTKVGWEITDEIVVWNIAWDMEATTYDNNCILYIFVYIYMYDLGIGWEIIKYNGDRTVLKIFMG